MLPIRRKLIPILSGLGIVALVVWLQLSEAPLVRQLMDRLDALVYDLRLNATLDPRPPDTRIVIVDIDEKSLREEGHWPWPRDRIGLLTERLFEAGAAVIGFDIVFAEPERNSARYVLTRMDELGLERDVVEKSLDGRFEEFDNNVRFAQSVLQGEVVLGFVFDHRAAQPVGSLPEPVRFTDPQAAASISLIEGQTHTGNLPVLQEAALRGGFFSLLPDADGVVRRAPLLERYQGEVYPSLALEIVRVFFMEETVGLHTAMVGKARVIEALEVAGIQIPTDSLARAVIPYRGRWGSFPYVSAADVLAERIDPAILEGAIVLVGTTAQGLFDLRATPVQSVYPGVEVHANLISGILDTAIPVEPSWAAGANLTVTLFIGLALAFVLPFLPSLSMVLLGLGVSSVLTAVNFWFWSEKGMVLELAPQLILVFWLMAYNLAGGYLIEARGRHQLKNMFGQYVPPELVEEMNRNPGESYGFEGESREMTVLFCDIRGFTTLSESLTAARLKELLNAFFTPMTRIIFEHRGTIDKYVGDMIMAFWGAPLHDERHAEHAIDTALAMLEETERLKAQFRQAGLPEVNIGIGLNSGPMNVGDMGSQYRRAYTVLGDAVNLASRLEGTTKFYGVSLVVGEQTRAAAGDAFIYRELDLVRVKGKAQAIRVYQPLCRRGQETPELEQELKMHEQALSRFRSRDWEGARALFSALHADHPDVVLYGMYLERIEDLSRNDPGEGWDGAYTRTSK